jgi:hypothetical protein
MRANNTGQACLVIPLLIPGERFNRTIVDYLKFGDFNETCRHC